MKNRVTEGLNNWLEKENQLKALFGNDVVKEKYFLKSANGHHPSLEEAVRKTVGQLSGQGQLVGDCLRVSPIPKHVGRPLRTGVDAPFRVVRVDADHKEPGGRRAVKRPLVTLVSVEPCLMPAGRELWWTGQADGRVMQFAARLTF